MDSTSERINSFFVKIHQSYDILNSDEFLSAFRDFLKKSGNEKSYYHEFAMLEINLRDIIDQENEIKEIINREHKLEEELKNLKSQIQQNNENEFKSKQ